MINTYIPYFKKKDQNILKQCLKTNFVSTAGPLVKKFQENFNKKYNFKYSVAVNSGTSALHLGLKAIGVNSGDSVILPSYTFAATANAIIYNNAYPWFFDCDRNFNLSIDKIEKSLKSKTYFKNKNLVLKKNNSIVRAIMPVSTFGKKLEFSKLIKFSEKYNLKILFDTAACHDPKIFNFKKNNKIHFCFSFNGNKTLTSGAGGIFASNSKKTIDRVKTLANVGKKFSKYDYEEIGFNYKMTNIQASLGLAQLDNLNNILLIKKKIFQNYHENLKNLKKFRCFYDPNYQNWVFVLIANSYKKFKSIQKLFQNSKIQLDFFWKPLHLQKPYKKFLHENLEFTEFIWNKVLVLPSHPGVKKKDQEKIINILNNIHD
mgnify:CR=1 FL=1|tara:strand:- start:2561 stop:3682 length:1122 start_codon:yes stop_codon:yes gene_type:complete